MRVRVVPAARPARRCLRCGESWPLVYLGGASMKRKNHEARQTGSPMAHEAVPERASPRPRSRQSPNSRSDSDRMSKAGPRRSTTRPRKEVPMNDPSVFVRIDASQGRLDVHVRPSGDAFAVPNDPQGIADLLARLAPARPALVVLEAPGGLG